MHLVLLTKLYKKILSILGIFYIIVVSILSAVAPQVVQDYVYLVPRNVFPAAIILPILIIYIMMVNLKKMSHVPKWNIWVMMESKLIIQNIII